MVARLTTAESGGDTPLTPGLEADAKPRGSLLHGCEEQDTGRVLGSIAESPAHLLMGIGKHGAGWGEYNA